jgi:hypothetical protein
MIKTTYPPEILESLVNGENAPMPDSTVLADEA